MSVRLWKEFGELHASAGQSSDECKVADYPDGWNTFKQLYYDDGNHPSDQGTYLEGLIIASTMTGEPSRA